MKVYCESLLLFSSKTTQRKRELCTATEQTDLGLFLHVPAPAAVGILWLGEDEVQSAACPWEGGGGLHTLGVETERCARSSRCAAYLAEGRGATTMDTSLRGCRPSPSSWGLWLAAASSSSAAGFQTVENILDRQI